MGSKPSTSDGNTFGSPPPISWKSLVMSKRPRGAKPTEIWGGGTRADGGGQSTQPQLCSAQKQATAPALVGQALNHKGFHHKLGKQEDRQTVGSKHRDMATSEETLPARGTWTRRHEAYTHQAAGAASSDEQTQSNQGRHLCAVWERQRHRVACATVFTRTP